MKTILKQTFILSIFIIPLLALSGCFHNGKYESYEDKIAREATEAQNIVKSQTMRFDYDSEQLQQVLQFTYYEEFESSFLLTHNGVANSTTLLKLQNVLYNQKKNGLIDDFQIVKNYSISGGKVQHLIPTTTILITKENN